ncbi:MAG: hypothetical protein WKF71_06145 [Pyrinomonadaceae bacterium]
MKIVPVTTPGGKPVTAVPGLTPKFPFTVLRPVLVTVVAANTPKVEAVPRLGATASGDDCALTPKEGKALVKKAATKTIANRPIKPVKRLTLNFRLRVTLLFIINFLL